MMIEIPLLFSTSLAIIFFYRYLTKEVLKKFDLLLILFVAIIGISTKITAIALILGVLLIFGVFIKLFIKDSKITKRFYSKWTIYFFVTALGAFIIFRLFTKTFLNADLVVFYLSQNKQLTGQQENILFIITKTLFNNFSFYLRDLSHMPPLAFFWIGSFVAYLLLKRSLLGFFLLVWVVVTYFMFSAVKPQAVQYILPIFVPLSISVGLFWGEFLKHRKKVVNNLLFILILSLIVVLGVFYLDKSEAIGWRTLITNQKKAADFLSEQAKFGERIISVGDGTRLLIRLAGDRKKLQTLNGAAYLCPDSIQDSVEWAITDIGPQNPIELKDITKPNWVKIISFPGVTRETIVWKNSNNTSSFMQNIDAYNLFYKKCARMLLIGKNEFKIYATPNINNNFNDKEDNLKIYLRPNLAKIVGELSISKVNLQEQNGKEQTYKLTLDHHKINQPIFISLDIPKNLKLKIKKIENIYKGD